MKERLLILGNSLGTREAVLYAKSRGVFTIVTDFFPVEVNREKQLADAYWMIDVKDIDRLEKWCRKEGITGIFAASSEFCLDAERKLCARLDLPFYASEKGWEASRNKGLFKAYCNECGLETPVQYQITLPLTKEQAQEISYPVIVKPADNCAQRGLSLCRDQEELTEGYQKALRASPGGNVVVEEYVEGEEFAAFYFLRNGKAHLVMFGEAVKPVINERENLGILFYRSRYHEDFCKTEDLKIQRLFQLLDCKEGNCYLQLIRREGRYYYLELGYRLDAVGSWTVLSQLNGFHSVKEMVDLALRIAPERELPEALSWDPEAKTGCSCIIWSRPGKIAKISGVEEARAMEGVVMLIQHFSEGEEVLKTDSLLQTAFFVNIIAGSSEDLKEKIRKVCETLSMRDGKGTEMLISYELT